ncbi:hypothetical protein [Nocardia sp. NPDC050710]|uniref:hypothetical protein n=1 Tax=Nocardia sp. NPDC050710 TaxID=3157220 RepID=UPI0033C1CC9A
MIGKFESNKDLIQELTSSGARHVGNIANIITGTVAEVTREIGEWITDAIEMNEAAAAARKDAAEHRVDRVDADYDAGETEVAPTAAPFVEAEVVESELDEPR